VIEHYEKQSKEQLIEALVGAQLSHDSLRTSHDSLRFDNLKLRAELDQLKRLIFGSKSERFVPLENPTQTTLAFDVASQDASPVVTQTITYKRNTPQTTFPIKTGRKPLPAHLERVSIVIEPLQDVTGLKKIGQDITEELELSPARFFVNQYIRPKYAKANGEGVLIGELPSRVIEKGIPGPGLLASILIEKYVDHLPCYRQIQRFERSGVTIAPSTMSEWISAGVDLIAPLYDVLKKEVLSSGYIQADETPIKVMDKDKKGTTHRGYYWVYHAPEKNLVLFDYRAGRGREGPATILSDFKGYLQTDGYAAYDSFDTQQITLLNCMAHARRYFEQAVCNDRVRAEFAMGCIQKLYAVERHCREHVFTNEQRKLYRENEAVGVLDELHQWLIREIINVPPQSTMGKAMSYMLARWERLCVYVQDGRLEIDNNLVENAIRPVAVGRKNYLFAGSHNAAQRAAMIYSLMGSCKKNNVEPYIWMKNVLANINDCKASQLVKWLPNWGMDSK
jgi:transposase